MSIYGLLGKNIGYSFSKEYFTEKFQKEHIPSKYQNFDIKTIEEIEKVILTPDLRGLNVTIPYKQQIIPYLDELDPIAKEIGAVNVIKINENQNLIGYNSDCYGFTESLTPLLHKDIKKALILGTGGASKAISYSLEKLGIAYVFISRNPDDHELCYESIDEDVLHSYKLIINCTPLGTFPDTNNHPNIPYEYLGSQHILYDLIYNPEETTFMKKGKSQGASVSNGLKMLILQAEKSWEIWNS